MNDAAEYLDPTAAPLRSQTELLSLDTTLLQGRVVVPAPGLVYPFAVARHQFDAPLMGVRWMPLELLSAKGNVAAGQGRRYTLTLRDRDGRYVVQDLPLLRMAELASGPGSWTVRGLLIGPSFIDWRRSFVRAVAPLPAGILYFDLLYA
jgi:hypothetical protein